MTTEQDLPNWITRGKTIRQLISELQAFEDLDMEVLISIDEGTTRKPISLVGVIEGQCALIYCG